MYTRVYGLATDVGQALECLKDRFQALSQQLTAQAGSFEVQFTISGERTITTNTYSGRRALCASLDSFEIAVLIPETLQVWNFLWARSSSKRLWFFLLSVLFAYQPREVAPCWSPRDRREG